MTKSLRTLLIFGLTTLISFGQESPPTESPPKVEPEALGPGDHTRTLQVDGRERSYLVHVPPQYDPKKPTPVVLVFHGGGSNARADGPILRPEREGRPGGLHRRLPPRHGTVQTAADLERRQLLRLRPVEQGR